MKNFGNNVWLGIINMIYSIHSIDDLPMLAETVLKQIRWLVPFDHAMFIQPQKDAIRILASIGFEQKYLSLYEENYRRYDYASGIKIGGNSIVYKDSDIVERTIWLNSSFYREFCDPNGIMYCAHMILTYHNEFCGEIVLFRDEKSINGVDFKANAEFIMNLLKEHLALSIARIVGNDLIEVQEKEEKKELVPKENMQNLIQVCAKQYKLTRREKEILELLVDGIETSEICEQLMITLNTLKKHILNIYKKMGVNSRIQLFTAMNSLAAKL